MITINGEETTIEISDDDLVQAIALLKDLKEFCEGQQEVNEGKEETVKALNTAIETMSAFWIEHFGEVTE